MIHRPQASTSPISLDWEAFTARQAQLPSVVRQRSGFFVFFAQNVYPLLEAQRSLLNALYHPTQGCPSEDPVLLQGVLILQFIERLPDRQAAEAVCFDQRWQMALHLPQTTRGFHPSLLTQFRQRLLESSRERMIFDTVLDLLTTHGWVSRRSRQRLDSTHVCGLLSDMSRLECVRETLRLALEALDRAGCFPIHFRALWECYVEGKLNPRDRKEALQKKMNAAGEDIRSLLAWVETQSVVLQRCDWLSLLRRVFAENFEMIDAQLNQTRCQPTGAVHNPHEAQAQWSSKSTTRDKTWIGYKVQVAETVEEEPRQKSEPTKSFLTAIVTQNATESDKPGMAEVLDQQVQMGLEAPSHLYVDGAYVSALALHQAQQQGRELVGPAPASPHKGPGFTVDQFHVQVESLRAVCPAGQINTQCSRLIEERTSKISYRFEWNHQTCQSCSLRGQCLSPNQLHRTINVGEHHTLLQSRRRQMETPEFKQAMYRRNAIEGTQSELIRAYGLRNARYRGKAKVRLQNYFIGAACNLRRLYRRIRWEVAHEIRAITSLAANACA